MPGDVDQLAGRAEVAEAGVVLDRESRAVLAPGQAEAVAGDAADDELVFHVDARFDIDALTAGDERQLAVAVGLAAVVGPVGGRTAVVVFDRVAVEIVGVEPGRVAPARIARVARHVDPVIHDAEGLDLAAAVVALEDDRSIHDERLAADEHQARDGVGVRVLGTPDVNTYVRSRSDDRALGALGIRAGERLGEEANPPPVVDPGAIDVRQPLEPDLGAVFHQIGQHHGRAAVVGEQHAAVSVGHGRHADEMAAGRVQVISDLKQIRRGQPRPAPFLAGAAGHGVVHGAVVITLVAVAHVPSDITLNVGNDVLSPRELPLA